MLTDATTYRLFLARHNVTPPPVNQGALWCPLGYWKENGMTFFGVPRNEDEIAAYVDRVLSLLPPAGRTKGLAVVEVNHGAWVVKCPCGSAQRACRTDHRMFCPDCRNVGADGAWVTVVWPDNVEEIEVILEARIYEVNRNWLPHESVETLRAENWANGAA